MDFISGRLDGWVGEIMQKVSILSDVGPCGISNQQMMMNVEMEWFLLSNNCLSKNITAYHLMWQTSMYA